MSCEEMRELFSASLESSLDAALTLKLESHIQMCSACRTELDGLRLVWDKLDVLEKCLVSAERRTWVRSRSP